MKKIMFNDRYGLTQAVLDRRKTQTRRIMKGKPLLPTDEIESAGILGDEAQIIANGGESLITMKLPYKHGEVVAVAQSYRECGGLNEAGVPRWDVISQTVGSTNAGWDNKMFVRADLMPHQIRILEWDGVASQYYVGYEKEIGRKTFLGKTPREAFAHLIDKVSGKGTWDSNPYVWVYDFELIK